MLYETKERQWIKYYCSLLDVTMKQIKTLEQAGGNSQELDDLYSNIFTWCNGLSDKVKEIWDSEEK